MTPNKSENFLYLFFTVLGGLSAFMWFAYQLRPAPTAPPSYGSTEYLEVDIPDIISLSECARRPLSGDIAKFFPNQNSCRQHRFSEYKVEKILDNESSPNPIDTDTIVLSSKYLKTTGQIEDVILYILATVDDAAYAPTRTNAVYFYIDSGEHGGFIDATRSRNGELYGSGVFLSSDVPITIIKYLNVPTRVAVRANRGSGDKYVDLGAVIKTEGMHPFYAYVSKPKYGRIIDASIAYTCEIEGCSIELIPN